MKWNEFKAVVEEALAGQDPDIAYVDVTMPEAVNIQICEYNARLCIHNKEDYGDSRF